MSRRDGDDTALPATVDGADANVVANSSSFRALSDLFAGRRKITDDTVFRSPEKATQVAAEGSTARRRRPPVEGSEELSGSGAVVGGDEEGEVAPSFDRDIVAAAATSGPQEVTVEELARRADWATAAAEAAGARVRRPSWMSPDDLDGEGAQGSVGALTGGGGSVARGRGGSSSGTAGFGVRRQQSTGAASMAGAEGVGGIPRTATAGRQASAGGQGGQQQARGPAPFASPSHRSATEGSGQAGGPAGSSMRSPASVTSARANTPLLVPSSSTASARASASSRGPAPLSLAGVAAPGAPPVVGGAASGAAAAAAAAAAGGASSLQAAGPSAAATGAPQTVWNLPPARAGQQAQDGTAGGSGAGEAAGGAGSGDQPKGQAASPWEDESGGGGAGRGAGAVGAAGAGIFRDLLKGQHTLLVIEFTKGSATARYRFMRRAEILAEARKYAAAGALATLPAAAAAGPAAGASGAGPLPATGALLSGSVAGGLPPTVASLSRPSMPSMRLPAVPPPAVGAAEAGAGVVHAYPTTTPAEVAAGALAEGVITRRVAQLMPSAAVALLRQRSAGLSPSEAAAVGAEAAESLLAGYYAYSPGEMPFGHQHQQQPWPQPWPQQQGLPPSAYYGVTAGSSVGPPSHLPGVGGAPGYAPHPSFIALGSYAAAAMAEVAVEPGPLPTAAAAEGLTAAAGASPAAASPRQSVPPVRASPEPEVGAALGDAGGSAAAAEAAGGRTASGTATPSGSSLSGGDSGSSSSGEEASEGSPAHPRALGGRRASHATSGGASTSDDGASAAPGSGRTVGTEGGRGSVAEGMLLQAPAAGGLASAVPFLQDTRLHAAAEGPAGIHASASVQSHAPAPHPPSHHPQQREAGLHTAHISRYASGDEDGEGGRRGRYDSTASAGLGSLASTSHRQGSLYGGGFTAAAAPAAAGESGPGGFPGSFYVPVHGPGLGAAGGAGAGHYPQPYANGHAYPHPHPQPQQPHPYATPYPHSGPYGPPPYQHQHAPTHTVGPMGSGRGVSGHHGGGGGGGGGGRGQQASFLSELVSTFLQSRDLRVVDSGFELSREPAVLVRRHCVVINLPPVRAIIMGDKCFFFPEEGADAELLPILQRLTGGQAPREAASGPDGEPYAGGEVDSGAGTGAGATPEGAGSSSSPSASAEGPVPVTLVHRGSPVAGGSAGEGEGEAAASGGAAASPTPPPPSSSSELPWEFFVLETFLLAVTSSINAEYRSLGPEVQATIRKLVAHASTTPRMFEQLRCVAAATVDIAGAGRC